MSLMVNNRIIKTPVKDIIELLRQQCFVNHLDRLRNIEIKSNNIRITCPFHSGGHERTPSCEILLEDKGSTPAGTVHCFGCGYRASLVKFIANCLNISYKQATEWILSVSNYDIIQSTRDISEIELKLDTEDVEEEVPEVSIDELKQYDYIHPYMFERKLTDDIIKKFDVGYDPKTDSLTFPVYVDGKCVFVAKRRVKYKRFDLPKLKNKPIYGLDYITDNEFIICESIIDALTCWSYGKQAVALFGTASDYQLKVLNNVRQRKLVIGTDGDEAGDKAARRIAKALTNKLVTRLDIPKGKDINDLSKEEFDKLEEIFV